MGSSFTEFRGKGFWERDGALEFLLYLLAQEARRPDSPDWLKRASVRWNDAAHGAHGGGCIHADLDEILDSEEKVQSFVRLVEGRRAWLLDQGPVLKCEWLNSLGIGTEGSQYTSDVETERYTTLFDRLLNLLRGIGEPDAKTSG